jgi:excisionase family DNA binding protein
MEKDWYSPQELADILGLKVDTIREYIRKKQLPAYRFGRDYRVRKVDYEKWVEKRRTTTNTDEL